MYESEPMRESRQAARATGRSDGSCASRPTECSRALRSIPTTGWKSVALYRHPKDIAPPAPAKAENGDMGAGPGAWVGKREGTGGAMWIEERWSSPLGRAMLAVAHGLARQNRRIRVPAHRRARRRAGLIAQPGGAPPTESGSTELGKTRAVFENPRHDSPQRIVVLSSRPRVS